MTFKLKCETGQTLLYEVNDDEKTVTISKDEENEPTGKLVIPASVVYENKEYTVTDILSGAFYECGELISVTIPDTVTSISDYAFRECRKLKSVNIPDSVTDLGYGAFNYCESLTKITIGNGVTEIDEYAFEGCSALEKVVIGSSVEEIVKRAFSDCTMISEITCYAEEPPCMDEDYVGGFEGVVLDEATLKVPAQSLDDYKNAEGWDMFENIVPLKQSKQKQDQKQKTDLAYEMNEDKKTLSVKRGKSKPTGELVIPASATYKGKKYAVTDIDDEAFENCKKLTSVIIPDSVTSIGESAFYDCSGLTAITIPNSVTTIEGNAFQDCTKLTSINVAVDNPNYKSIDGVLYSKDGKILIYSPEGKKGKFIIPNSVTSIGEDAFYACKGITSVTIGNSVTSIGESAFCNCSKLTSVTIPNSVTSIGGSAFYNCSKLTSVTIPNSVTSIGNEAFGYCEGLTSITIPNSVTSIGDGAFKYCEGLTEITIPDSVTSIGENAFWGCSGLTSVTIPNSVTSIGDWAFKYCTGLTSITIPDSVTSIGDGAFKYCEGLTEITIPDSVTSIGREAFYDTGWWNNQPDGIIYKDGWCLGYKGDEPTGALTIQKGIKSIGGGAFKYCKGLTEITCKAVTPPTIVKETFAKDWEEYFYDLPLYVPAASVEAYKTADYWKEFKDIKPLK